MAAAPAAPLRLLLSVPARERLQHRIASALQGAAHVFVEPGADTDLAFVSRDVTGLSTKHHVLPATQRFYDAMQGAASLRWVHIHSAGVDRPIFRTLIARGVAVSASSGANASVVVQTALAGVLALARRFPQLMAAQREHRWAPLLGASLPRDLPGQTAVIVGWGPIGQGIAGLLTTLGMHVIAVRSRGGETSAPATEAVAFEQIAEVLPRADWLLLACPLTERTRGLIDASALAALPAGAQLVNVARGEIVIEAALIEALSTGRLAGAFLDVFEHEPLPAESPLWSLPNVIATPHSAGHSDGNEGRVDSAFLANLESWHRGEALRHLAR